MLSKAWKQRKLGRGGIAMLIIWGVVAVNQSSLSATQTELGRRQNLNQSRFYR
ncbi:MAG: hypothetical protein MI864_07650 [Pseudomonadales bacterium]|nr:hypothetical protein [Pseudomonadales bacterium]